MENSTLAIQRVPLDSLTLDPANARTHPENNLEAIIGSLRRFGQAEPLVVQAGTRRVIGGNGRLVAMRKLGWTECDVVELAIDDLKATALGIALNRTSELATWDLPALTKRLEELRVDGGLDGVGYDESDLDEMVAELGALDVDVEQDEVPLPPDDPVTQRGDLIILGNPPHRG